MLGFPVVRAWLHLSDGTLIRILKLKFDMIIKLMIEGRLENIKATRSFEVSFLLK